MSLAERFAAIDSSSRQCKTCQWITTLSQSDRDWLDKKIADLKEQGKGTRRLHRACKAEGLDCVESSFRAHFNEHTGVSV